MRLPRGQITSCTHGMTVHVWHHSQTAAYSVIVKHQALLGQAASVLACDITYEVLTALSYHQGIPVVFIH